jgi:hypothetical protein
LARWNQIIIIMMKGRNMNDKEDFFWMMGKLADESHSK